MPQAAIYRVGSMEPANDVSPELEDFLTRFDNARPSGRTGRRGALFASPNMKQHSRWVVGVSFLKFGDYTQSNVVTVNPDTVYIYPVSVYEDASAFDGFDEARAQKAIETYWSAGMTLTQYLKEHVGDDTPSTGSWEILFTLDDVISVSTICNETVVTESTEDRREEVMRLLFPKEYSQGIVYGDSEVSV